MPIPYFPLPAANLGVGFSQMQSKLMSLFALVLLIIGNIPAWGMGCCKPEKVKARPSCCCMRMQQKAAAEEARSELPQWTRRPCRCSSSEAPEPRSKPLLVWQSTQHQELEFAYNRNVAIKRPDLALWAPLIGSERDSSPRAPPCPLYLLYGVCLS